MSNMHAARRTTLFLCHFALWFSMCFATPVFVALQNSADVSISIWMAVSLFGAFSAALSVATYLLSSIPGANGHYRISVMLLATAIVLAFQSNVVNDHVFYYGEFNGAPVDFRANGWKFHAEWICFVLAIPIVGYALLRMRRLPYWIPALPLVSFALLLLPALMTGAVVGDQAPDEVDGSVFRFSPEANLIHLLPDGLQSDIVQQVFEENSALTEHFQGFTLFANNVGLYQGTAPALVTLFTGQPFEFDRGHDYSWVEPYLEERAYQNALADAGFRLDYVPINELYCLDRADSCHARSFNDMKARGYVRFRNDGALYSTRLIADLSLFRLFPMIVKERIYANGHWFLSDTNGDGSAPWPDPVIREWTERIEVAADNRPVYKWYHYIGTHIPAQWDSGCKYLRDTEHVRDSFKQQTLCVLSGIATFLDKLKSLGIYDRTAIVISGDHGINIPPYDQVQPPFNASLYPGLNGSARPALLIKPMNQSPSLRISDAPTSLLDVAATALELVGIDNKMYGRSAYSIADNPLRRRLFTPYSIADLWGTDPVPYDVYEVTGDVRDGRNWKLAGIVVNRTAPADYQEVTYTSAGPFLRGALMSPNSESDGSWITSHQLGFLISPTAETRAVEELVLTLHIPDWIQEQSFTLSINGQILERNIAVPEVQDFWQEVLVGIPAGRIQEGVNFVSIEFETVGVSPDPQLFRASALVRSIVFRQKSEEASLAGGA